MTGPALSADIRAGWQCPGCKVCQHCRQPGEEGRQLCCDICDRAFHIFCARPVLGSLPKSGWKCRVSVERWRMPVWRWGQGGILGVPGQIVCDAM